MKANVTELTHDELVNLFSTALYGNDMACASYDKMEYKRLPESQKTPEKDRCIEDILADLILAGKDIRIDVTDEGVSYINLKDILRACSSEEGLSLAVELFIDEEGDYFTAWNLLQIALYGEVIFG